MVIIAKEPELNYPSLIEFALFADLFGILFALFAFVSGFNELEDFEKKSGLAAFILAVIIFSSGDRM